MASRLGLRFFQKEVAFALVPTVVLAGEPLVYTDQDWESYPDAACVVLHETEDLFLDQWMRLAANLPRVVVDSGESTRWRLIWIRPPKALGMCEDLMRGMARVRFHCHENRPLD